MSKEKLNVQISAKDLIRKLKDRGWFLERQNKHLIYGHPERSEKIILPTGKDISPGVVRKTLNLIEKKYYGGNNKGGFNVSCYQ